MIETIIGGKTPEDFIYAPNYWQWFAHHKSHGILPDEIKHCETQLDLIRYLGLDLLSRNLYSDQQKYWFGGLCEESFDSGMSKEEECQRLGADIHTTIKYRLKGGELEERLVYVFEESTVVQSKFLITNYNEQLELFEEFVSSRKWSFNRKGFEKQQKRVGPDGIVMLGEFFSPLKLLHIALGPINSVYFLMEHPEPAKRIMHAHEKAQLAAIENAVNNGVRIVMAMDNLDSMFHPPHYVEQYSASFYEKASKICHKKSAKFMIHACGNQKENLELISGLGVDGLEGVAYPPLGNVSLLEALEMTHDRFIVTGGISASEISKLKSKAEVFLYIKNLFQELKPFKNRYVLSASCNTPINTPWETIKHFRDAWNEYKNL